MGILLNAKIGATKSKQLISIIVLQFFSLINGITALFTGQQLKINHWIWAKTQSFKRDKEFQRKGFKLFQLIDSEIWTQFSSAANKSFEERGIRIESAVDWAVNNRINLNLHELPDVNNFVNQIIHSENFINQLDLITGDSKWNVYSTQIWRNYPEDFNNSKKEINSTFFHVDNGGPKENRLFLNIFMYLTITDYDHGPFIFYDAPTSRKINRKYFFDIIRFGNLRKMRLAKKIEEEYSPNILITNPGQALIINNQECLHRAGFCKKEHRDMLQILITT
jgi:hypothetical protein